MPPNRAIRPTAKRNWRRKSPRCRKDRTGTRSCSGNWTSVGSLFAVIHPQSVQPLGQGLSCGRMLIFTKPQEIIRAHIPGQPQLFRSYPDPLAGYTLTFIVVITDAQVFFKVFPGVGQIVLGLGRQHGKQSPKSRPSFCVKITQNDRRHLLYWSA